MVFGRCFEKALHACFEQEDPAAALFKEWGAYRDTPFEYRKGETWDRLVHQEFICFRSSLRTGAFTFPIPKRTCSLSSLGVCGRK